MKVFVHDDTGELTLVEGQPGNSLMVTLRDEGLNIAAQCGGEASCGTCHVYVGDEWRDRVKPALENETAMLDFVDERKENSRLSCQICLSEELDGLTVTIAPGSAF